MTKHLYNIFILIFASLTLFYGVKVLLNQEEELPAILQEAKTIPVILHGKPKFTQESIDIAVHAYNIKILPFQDWPKIDLQLNDRGLTIPGNIIYNAKVLIGPEAYSSWGILGSTLAHEMEIHCNQNVYLIVLKDLLGFNGTHDAEREAYTYEIQNQQRFNLTLHEVSEITNIMNYYYPTPKAFSLSSKAIKK